MQGNEISQCGAKEKVKETAASMVLSELERTVERAQKIAAVVAERTNTITRQEPPVGMCEQAAGTPRKEYPPFFDQIRQKAESINNSLSNIEDIMRRCEL